MIGRMTFFDGDKCSSTRGADLFLRYQLGLDGRTILFRFDNAGTQMYRCIARRWPEKFDVKIGGHGAVGRVLAVAFHHKVCRCPIGMTVEQRADDPAVEHTRKRLLMRLSVPRRNDFVAIGKAVDMQPLIIRRPAAKADARRRVSLLQRFRIAHTIISKTNTTFFDYGTS